MDIEDFSKKALRVIGLIIAIGACIVSGYVSARMGPGGKALARGISAGVGLAFMIASVVVAKLLDEDEQPNTAKLVFLSLATLGISLMSWQIFI